MKLLKLKADYEGIFIERINKFLGKVKISDKEEFVHIHDPGRLKELLYKGNRVLIKDENKPNRKTKFDLIAAFKNDHWVLVHSNYHRKIAENIIKNKIIGELSRFNKIEAEKKFNTSRIDFLLTDSKNQKKLWLEVKGCTLSENGIALFPDAPTKRGTKHLLELLNISKSDDYAGLLILVFRKDSECFMPNEKTDPEFSKAFYTLIKNKNIFIFPVQLTYDGNYVKFKKILPLCSKDV